LISTSVAGAPSPRGRGEDLHDVVEGDHQSERIEEHEEGHTLRAFKHVVEVFLDLALEGRYGKTFALLEHNGLQARESLDVCLDEDALKCSPSVR
jgi:hypothetical protein